MNVHIQIKNLGEIRRAFNAAPALMSKSLGDAIRKSTFLIEGQSKIRTPVRTGFLRSSHVTRFEGGGLGFKGIVEPTAQYAGFVHEGTRYMKGRPFLKQAAESATGTVQNLFEEGVQKTLNQIGRMT